MHKTEKITIKRANVDRGILPTIKWLNAMNGVETTHCCEGYDKDVVDEHGQVRECAQGPYVLFRCENLHMLCHILEMTRPFLRQNTGGIGINFYPEWGLRFHIDFKSRRALREFQNSRLTKSGKPKWRGW